jgi:hypothetical protein
VRLANALSLNLKTQTSKPMKKIEHNLHIGSKLYWSDAPEIIAGVVVRFTDKRDVVINFFSGNEQGEKHYPIKLAKRFITKP